MAMPDLSIPAVDKPVSRFSMALRRFVANPLAVMGLAILAILVLVAIFGPMAWVYGPTEITPDLSQPPSWAHPMGTDTLGRDMFALVMRGMQQSLLIAGTVAVIASVLGTVLGIVAGYYGGKVDTTIMRLVDLFLTIPTIALAAFLGNNLSQSGVSWLGLALVLGALFWTSVARLVRGVSLNLREMPYIKAAKVMGAGRFRIMLGHMVPNVADHIIVATALLVGVAILSETGLSFLGFGVRPPDTSLGLLIANAQSAVLTRPWMFYGPGFIIILIVLSINYVGEGLRDAFNPKASPTNPLTSRQAIYIPDGKLPQPDPGHLVSITNFSVVFPKADKPAVNAINLHIKRGEVLGLVGESGSGKSLTSLAISGLLPNGAIRSGRVAFDGQDTGGLDFEQWRTLRGKRIATILQDPSTSLNPVLTIGAQFAESFRLKGQMSQKEMRARAVELLRLMAIRDPESRLDQYPHQMSGGIRQRIVIAMSMIHDPDLIIADEPTTALDVTVQAQVLDALRIARERTHAAMLFITHDLALVAGIADRVAVMRHGKVVEESDVFSIFTKPQDDYTRRLLSLAPRLDAVAAAPQRLESETAGTPLLRVENLSRHFLKPRSRLLSEQDRVIHALCGVNFDLAPGETLGIVGESGSGKTTLLSTILGLYRPSTGRVIFEGVDLAHASRIERMAASKRMSVVFQDPYTSLDPRMTVREILEEPAHIHGEGATARRRALEVLDRVKLPMSAIDRFPHEFSGGQRQRIAIARALMLDPRLVFLDEPVSALDVSIQQDIIELLGELRRDSQVAYLLVAHDLAVVAELSHRIGVMYGGQMVELGETSQVIGAPSHRYTRTLLDAVPIPDPELERRRLATGRAAPWPGPGESLPACTIQTEKEKS